MTGLYETFFSTLSGDATLQGLLSATANDKKVYPVWLQGKSSLPAIRVAVSGVTSDIGLPIDRPVVDVYMASAISPTQLNSISARVDVLLNRKRLSGPNGFVMHICYKVVEQDDFDEATQEYRRVIRYSIISK